MHSKLYFPQSTKAEKELMRPLYDRYRNVKRMLAKGVPVSWKEAYEFSGTIHVCLFTHRTYM